METPLFDATVACLVPLQLDLSWNKIDAEGAKPLADALCVNASLTECNLRDNKLTEEGWCAIFDALRDNPQNKMAKWELRGQRINPTIVKSLAAYVAGSASLTSVWTPGYGTKAPPTSISLCYASILVLVLAAGPLE